MERESNYDNDGLDPSEEYIAAIRPHLDPHHPEDDE